MTLLNSKLLWKTSTCISISPPIPPHLAIENAKIKVNLLPGIAVPKSIGATVLTDLGVSLQKHIRYFRECTQSVTIHTNVDTDIPTYILPLTRNHLTSPLRLKDHPNWHDPLCHPHAHTAKVLITAPLRYYGNCFVLIIAPMYSLYMEQRILKRTFCAPIHAPSCALNYFFWRCN